ncbi:probable mitochondrial glutathione transporter SLC25A40 [Cuculus canorus]|uniref:probable mitochondrial glutathione transporter SLC25A40 n=1 Tax=Cuculus canorus TaxID=55661 RepID=UPI0023AA9626|nr:probable mitochondrial glutathione transporter SLC25A40 [Cuculus canorus]
MVILLKKNKHTINAVMFYVAEAKIRSHMPFGMPLVKELSFILVTPLDIIKSRLQVQSNAVPRGRCFVYENGLMDRICVCENGYSQAWYKKPGRLKGTMDAFLKIIQREGVKSLWSRLPPTLITALPTTVIYFTCYDQLSEALKSRLRKEDERIPVLAGSLSRVGSITAVSPLELIRTRIQYHKLSYKQLCISNEVATNGWLSLWRGWTSTILCVYEVTWKGPGSFEKKNGISGLFAGITPRLCGVAPASEIMISTYEYGKSVFSHVNEKINQCP